MNGHYRGNINTPKLQKTLVKPKPNTTHKKTVAKVETKIQFRGTCELSGADFGAYRKWVRDYECKNEDEAMTNFMKDLDKLKRIKQKVSNKGLMWTNVEVHKLN